ncbi:MAG TPA: hypothetical protein VHM88_21535 [Candidatus Acidoferrales bacterium]|nr:hypothetical protein [Candidatus Acidoferrales bacterium]
MGKAFLFVLFVVPLSAQQVVDRIVARVEDDIILLSEVRELGRYQQLVEGQMASEARLLDQLIDQWMVTSEAATGHYPRPSEADVDGALERLEKQLGGADTYGGRLRELGLSTAAVRRLVERQMYLTRYLDYKFRPEVQVDAAAIEKYYREQLAPSLAGKGQGAPPLETVQDQIRELLTERGINEHATRWLEETRSRLRVEGEGPGQQP